MSSATAPLTRRFFHIKKRKKRPADGQMSIVEHIEELRQRLFACLIIIGIGTIFGYIWYGTNLGPVPSLGWILKEPYCNLDPGMRLSAADGQCALLATTPFEMFMLRLKVGALAGTVLASPFWIAQIWAYITPGLKKNERRWTLSVGFATGFLFIFGAVIAYFVLFYGLEFLMSLGKDVQISALNGNEYFKFVITLIVVFGVSFEVPLITVLLNAAGVITYKQLKDKRRYIIVGLFIFAAFATPGQDPLSMVILALVLCLLMEIATQIARINDRKRTEKIEEWMNLEDDQASSIDSAQPIGQATHVDATQDVARATSIDRPTSLPDNPSPGTASRAPRSSSSARPHQQPQTNGRRDGLDLHSESGNFDDVL
ncbi:twin-arginine translocase subunit TatC [Corynebacterium anserum]|uniref:twin-arginine translocase subunit TatC n=1 Tax=Corynebacterium anserum TaxID=2684406 RepID=UPI0021AE5AB7|nr:twin-arginine translocase subunit TatC [Corynebacterium anserum]